MVSIISVTQNELGYLLDSLAPTLVLGIKNPFLGMTTEDKSMEIKAAHTSLVDKDLIHPNEDGDLVLDSLLSEAVLNIARPKKTIILQHSKKNARPERKYFFTGKNNIYTSLYKNGNPDVQLKLGISQTDLIEYYTSRFDFNPSFLSDTKFSISEAELLDFQQGITDKDADKTIAVLEQANLSGKAKKQLEKTIDNARDVISLVSIQNPAQMEVRQIRSVTAISDGKYVILFLTSHGSSLLSIEIEFVDIKRMKKTIRECII